jgi:Lar family restriction alleviation protein
MDELLPCPFCGGKANLYSECSGLKTIEYLIACEECRILTLSYTKENKAVEIWNKRSHSFDFPIEVFKKVMENVVSMAEQDMRPREVKEMIEECLEEEIERLYQED